MPDPIDILLEEYRALRKEVLETLKARYSLLALGLAAISLIINTSHFSADSTLFKILGIFGAQFLCLLILLFWFGEYMRGQKAGAFLAKLEDRINKATGKDKLLTWESSLRVDRRKTLPRRHYDLTVTPLLILSLVFFFLAISTVFSPLVDLSVLFIVISIVGIIAHLYIHRYILKRMETIRLEEV